jgi:coproporphyrinogen III oxidase
MEPDTAIAAQADACFRELQAAICAALEAEDGAARFTSERWERPGGGGGLTRVLTGGAVFEQAGVNTSAVHGELAPEAAAGMPGDGRAFTAAGVSLVLHPRSPHVPTVHANFRCLTRGRALWFGGGADLTPYYPVLEDVRHFHRTLRAACDRHDPAFYPRFKRWADEYFYLPHRRETRGVGGVFFDYLTRDPGADLAFVRDLGAAFLPAYRPIVGRRRGEPYGDGERQFQLLRRGRYVEFNLLYDRGTRFGLQTGGRTESILMSLPPAVRWAEGASYPPGSREAELGRWLTPTDWLAGESGG